MASQRIEITIDAAAAQADLAFLAEAADRLPEVRQLLVDMLDSGIQLARIDNDRSLTPGAGQCPIVLQLADPLLKLSAAIRAGEFDG